MDLCLFTLPYQSVRSVILHIFHRLTGNNGVLLSDDFDAYINRGYENLSTCSFLIESPK